MPGWLRNRRAGAPAAAPAVPPPDRPRDDWRTLPPLPTVLRSAVSTVDVGAFREHLSSWRDPSFLAPLSHQIDPGGPAGLITGLASPEPRSYHHDHPLPLAVRRPAPVQRSAAHRSSSALMSAPGVDHAPLPLSAIPADPEQQELASAEPANAPAQEVSGVPAEPPAENPEPPVTGPDQPGEAPLVSRREGGPVTAQRQLAQDPPQPPPKRRLGLGAPLNNPADGSPAPAGPVPGPPLVARSIAASPAEVASRTPHRLARPEPTSRSAGPTDRTPPIPVSVQPAPADQARPPVVGPLAHSLAWPVPAEPARAESVPAEPAPAGNASPADAPAWATPPADAPAHAELPAEDAPHPAQAPLIGALSPNAHPIEPPLTPPTATSLPGPRRQPAVQAAIQRSVLPAHGPAPAAWRAVQRSAPGAEAPPGTPQAHRSAPDPAARPSAPSALPSAGPTWPSAAPGSIPAPVTADPPPARFASAPAGRPDRLLVTAQRLPSDPAVTTILPHRMEAAPLLGDRPPARVLDAPPAPGPRSAPAPAVADVPRGPVQRSVQPAVPLSRPGGRAGAAVGGPLDRPEPVAAFADPGAIAVARGLARRDPDGSVVFDVQPGSAPPAPLPPETVQRQDASEPSPGSEPSVAPTPPPSVPATAPAPAAGPAPAPANPPLDELARQLFGPLSARLRAELRLDRERAGLLTDLRP